MKQQPEFEAQLDAFDPRTRRRALDGLRSDQVGAAPSATDGNVNMHCHSFFSYNAEGHSPSRIAWECHKAGLYAAGLCDFDVLDGLEEFLEAGRLLGLRTAVHLETRVFLEAFADVDISSPGEPGVTYIMGAGFPHLPRPGTPQAEGLAGYAARARARNEALLARVNPHVPEIALDYAQDVLPLTPRGNATERHIVAAYLRKAKRRFEHPRPTAEYLAALLGIGTDKALALLADAPAAEDKLRARLVKSGGLGYEQPSPDTFPRAEAFAAWVTSCRAMPTVTWLDGTSGGERDPRRLLECMTAMGCVAVNIIPDRNWRAADPETRAAKRANLRAFVETAEAMALPINIGTEMNKAGLPFVDDLDNEALSAYRNAFLRGARIMVGQSVLARYADGSYVGERAAAAFPAADRRNVFFASVGARPALTEAEAGRLEEMGPEKAWSWFMDREQRGLARGGADEQR